MFLPILGTCTDQESNPQPLGMWDDAPTSQGSTQDLNSEHQIHISNCLLTNTSNSTFPKVNSPSHQNLLLCCFFSQQMILQSAQLISQERGIHFWLVVFFTFLNQDEFSAQNNLVCAYVSRFSMKYLLSPSILTSISTSVSPALLLSGLS